MQDRSCGGLYTSARNFCKKQEGVIIKEDIILSKYGTHEYPRMHTSLLLHSHTCLLVLKFLITKQRCTSCLFLQLQTPDSSVVLRVFISESLLCPALQYLQDIVMHEILERFIVQVHLFLCFSIALCLNF